MTDGWRAGAGALTSRSTVLPFVTSRAQHDALSAPQQQEVVVAHAGQAVTAAPATAASGVARTAVDTALAQVGDAYVWVPAGRTPSTAPG